MTSLALSPDMALYLPRHPLLAAAACTAVLAVLLRRRALVAAHAATLVGVLFPAMGLRASAPGSADRAIRPTSYNVFFGKLGARGFPDRTVHPAGPPARLFDEAGRGFGYTFPAKIPWMRIDRALTDVDARRAVRFLDVGVAPRGASDHRALRVVLTLER